MARLALLILVLLGFFATINGVEAEFVKGNRGVACVSVKDAQKLEALSRGAKHKQWADLVGQLLASGKCTLLHDGQKITVLQGSQGTLTEVELNEARGQSLWLEAGSLTNGPGPALPIKLGESRKLKSAEALGCKNPKYLLEFRSLLLENDLMAAARLRTKQGTLGECIWFTKGTELIWIDRGRDDFALVRALGWPEKWWIDERLIVLHIDMLGATR